MIQIWWIVRGRACKVGTYCETQELPHMKRKGALHVGHQPPLKCALHVGQQPTLKCALHVGHRGHFTWLILRVMVTRVTYGATGNSTA